MKSNNIVTDARRSKLKNGSTISSIRSNKNTILIEAKPYKRKHNQPKSGLLHLKEDAAFVLLVHLILILDIKSEDVLYEIQDRVLNSIDVD